MTSRRWIALLTAAGAAVAIAVAAWPAAAKQLKPLVIHTAPPLQLHVVRTTFGTDDPHFFSLSRLVPRGSRVEQVWYVPSRKLHRQVLVEWTERHRHFPYGHMSPRPFRWGLKLWTETSATRWHAVNIPIIRWAPPDPVDIRITFADVTGDGRPDLLFEQDPMTNHGCGPHQIFATSARGVTTRVFSSYLCETILHGDHGLLALDLPYGVGMDAVCCPSFEEHLRLRWSGNRYVTDSVHFQRLHW
jgi:hypothetical protein